MFSSSVIQPLAQTFTVLFRGEGVCDEAKERLRWRLSATLYQWAEDGTPVQHLLAVFHLLRYGRLLWKIC